MNGKWEIKSSYMAWINGKKTIILCISYIKIYEYLKTYLGLK